VMSMFQGKVYVFDRVFKANTMQEPVYAITAKPIVKGNDRLCFLHKLSADNSMAGQVLVFTCGMLC